MNRRKKVTIMEGEMEIIEEGGERFVDEWKVDSSSDCATLRVNVSRMSNIRLHQLT